MGDGSSYARAWADLRRRKRLLKLFSGTFAAVVVTAGGVLVLCLWGGDPPFGLLLAIIVAAPLLGIGLGGAAIAHVVAKAIWLRGFRCPQCDQRFMPPFFERPSCQHCGLAVWSEGKGATGPRDNFL